ncbi:MULTISPECIES: hypothetical protein [Saccharibacillus]|uniref:Lipoprotein n=1 Tax=Saccharibacillus brassicae TaxID=2583377 RepID=A0A4Y6UUA5_SACBS|nr:MULTISPECIES: hypothetical protein [Saccharibacillus]MWJ29880.1 hypothetical protein [Saccharibacillus sp. WB 17]QDH21272.1 hypothetical protein FFV09_10685 [Saccharibacillus brassicae]
MKRKVESLAFCLFCSSLLLLAGCTSEEPSSWAVYDGATIEESFPVPKEASKTDVTADNTKMSYVRYSVPGLDSLSQIPEAYLDVIKAWGWTEQTDLENLEEPNPILIFSKGKTTVHLSLEGDYLTVLVPKGN